MKKGKLIIYSGPSGAGKGTVKELFFNSENLNLVYSVSATTRSPRKNEKNGIDYFFLSREEFEKWIKEHKFLEWAEYVGNLYGTPAHYVDKLLNEGKNVVLEIEVEGVKQVLAKRPDAISIFLVPPSIDELELRLTKRGTDSKEVISKRIERAKYEMSLHKMFKYVVVNHSPETAAEEIIDILIKELNE